MNGPYHPIHTLDEVDQQILRLKKRLQVNKQLAKDPINYRKRRADNERIRRKKLRENPQWVELQKEKQKQYYKQNPEPQIESSKKWNKANKERKNANNRASYARNKDKISQRNKEKRRLAKEVKNG